MGADSHLVKPNEPRPKKRFGQHFLRDTGVLERIVRWIRPAATDLFLEIGAGDGALSARLAPRILRLFAIEVDSDRLPQLKNTLEPFESATIVAGDILQLNLEDLLSSCLQPGRKLRVAGNLPYNIATAIIDRLLHSTLPIEDLCFMVQLEVAQRIIAKPGSRQYGFLSLDCQHRADVQFGFKVSPACFVPRPQVSSAVIALRPKSDALIPAFESVFEALGKASFSHRRKTLENSLRRHPVFGEISHALLNRAGIDGSRRAEELSVLEYERLAAVFLKDFTAG
jgi:16S rRNA (adenine1518-N6/adenine1519-N6)-dimethyltransferase